MRLKKQDNFEEKTNANDIRIFIRSLRYKHFFELLRSSSSSNSNSKVIVNFLIKSTFKKHPD